jgi:hypothetical protein
MAGLWSVLAKKHQSQLMRCWNSSVLYYGAASVSFSVYQACALASSNQYIPEVFASLEELLISRNGDREWVDSDAGKTAHFILENAKPRADQQAGHHDQQATGDI